MYTPKDSHNKEEINTAAKANKERHAKQQTATCAR